MRILFYDMGSYTYRDLKDVLEKRGHIITDFYYHFMDRYEDAFFDERMDLELSRNNYDAVFSINFFPLVARACNEKGIPYISWTYDSPLDSRLKDYFGMDTNHIFLFDGGEVEKYKKAGFGNVEHLPLATNVDRLERLVFTETTRKKYEHEMAFVGRIYESSLETLMMLSDDYLKGYIEGLFQTQFRVYGSYFLEDVISDDILKRLNDRYVSIGQNEIKLDKRGLAFAIAAQITHFERSFLLNELAEKYDVHIYTANKCDLSKKIKVHGPVKYFEDMNAVFRYSKLNLCPTLKCISTGIPLRALDVMGNGGVLFSNYQVELAEFFVDGEDVIMYESIEDAFEKADYYLKKDGLLKKIGLAGKEKVRKAFDYESRADALLGVI